MNISSQLESSFQSSSENRRHFLSHCLCVHGWSSLGLFQQLPPPPLLLDELCRPYCVLAAISEGKSLCCYFLRLHSSDAFQEHQKTKHFHLQENAGATTLLLQGREKVDFFLIFSQWVKVSEDNFKGNLHKIWVEYLGVCVGGGVVVCLHLVLSFLYFKVGSEA